MMNLDVVGRERPPITRSWDSDAAILYALGVGAGVPEPSAELEFSTELPEQRVLPTFATLLVPNRLSPDLGEFNPRLAVHAQEEVEFYHPFPAAGSATVTSRVIGMYDKGSGVLVVTEADISDASTRVPFARARSGIFFRGEGGYGGDRGPRDQAWELPDRAPDLEVNYRTRPEQGLLYRLNGDRNPLHVDPDFAKSAGFDRPILHGLCVFGVAGRALLHGLAGSDPQRLRLLSARLVAPFVAGEDLVVKAWVQEPGDALFTASKPDGTVVIGRGRVGFEEGP